MGRWRHGGEAERIVDIWEYNGIGLIIKWPSGVFFSNQTGGYACHHPQIEGVFAPVQDDKGPPSDAVIRELEDFFTGGKWGGWCHEGIDIETADFIDTLFGASEQLRFIKVDRALLTESEEAWVHVILYPEKFEPLLALIQGFKDGTGAVLTWNNSD